VYGMSNDSSVAGVFVQGYKELFTTALHCQRDMQHIVQGYSL